MPMGLRPQLSKIKDVRGRVVGYRATLGLAEANGTTAAEASEKCEFAVLEALNYGGVMVMHDLHTANDGDRRVWILERSVCGGWSYRIARPLHPGTHYDGHSTCQVIGASRCEAEDEMRRHWYSINVEPFVGALCALAGWAVRVSVPIEATILVAEGTHNNRPWWRQYFVVTDGRVATVHMEPAMLGGWRFTRTDVATSADWGHLTREQIVAWKLHNQVHPPTIAAGCSAEFTAKLLSQAGLL